MTTCRPWKGSPSRAAISRWPRRQSRFWHSRRVKPRLPIATAKNLQRRRSWIHTIATLTSFRIRLTVSWARSTTRRRPESSGSYRCRARIPGEVPADADSHSRTRRGTHASDEARRGCASGPFCRHGACETADTTPRGCGDLEFARRRVHWFLRSLGIPSHGASVATRAVAQERQRAPRTYGAGSLGDSSRNRLQPASGRGKRVRQFVVNRSQVVDSETARCPSG